MAEDSDLVASFMGITGADEPVALQMLEAADFDVEQAVNLYFAAEAAGGLGAPATSTGAGGAGAGHGGSRGRSPGIPSDDNFSGDDDDVRAPLPTKVERLYGDHYDTRGTAIGMAAAHHGLSGRPAAAAQPVDVFRDFRAEAEQQAAAAAGAVPAVAAAGAAAGGSAQPTGLSGLFQLPADLRFPGNLGMACERAAQEGQWLLLNVQSNTEFASHRLNRDTWSHDALKEILKGTFVFYQTLEGTQDGQALIQRYRLSALPVIVVVDPLTGAELWSRSGFTDPEKLMDELVPFMDHGPNDAGAASLAQTNLKRKAAAAAAPGAAGAGGGDSRGLSEDDELALAIAMSIGHGGPGPGQEQRGSDGAGGGDQKDDDELEEQQIWQQIQEAERKAAEDASRKTPEQAAAEASARLPPEPEEGAADAARVALRLPDGSRAQRRFRHSDNVSALYDYCVTLLPEAAAGRSYVITPAMPGAQPLSDQSQTLGAAQVAGAMLVVKLAD